MFTVAIAGFGTEAEFVVPSPVLALALVLRADRAGLSWRALAGSVGVPMEALRQIAAHTAATDAAEAARLAEALADDEEAARSTLN
ncbi:MAG: hypothetical protein ACJ735_16930 [Actinomycetes bacterium]